MMRTVMWVCLGVAAMNACLAELSKSANDTPLPKAPERYRWERFKEVQSAFLCPTNWHRIDKAGASSHTYALSKDPVKTNGLFETGLTLQVVKGLEKKKGIAPSLIALKMGETVLKNLLDVAQDDVFGRRLQDAKFLVRKRAPKTKRNTVS